MSYIKDTVHESNDALASTGMFLANSVKTVANTADKVVKVSGDTTVNVLGSTGKTTSNVFEATSNLTEIGADTTAIGSNAVKFVARGTKPESQETHEKKRGINEKKSIAAVQSKAKQAILNSELKAAKAELDAGIALKAAQVKDFKTASEKENELRKLKEIQESAIRAHEQTKIQKKEAFNASIIILNAHTTKYNDQLNRIMNQKKEIDLKRLKCLNIGYKSVFFFNKKNKTGTKEYSLINNISDKFYIATELKDKNKNNGEAIEVKPFLYENENDNIENDNIKKIYYYKQTNNNNNNTPLIFFKESYKGLFGEKKYNSIIASIIGIEKKDNDDENTHNIEDYVKNIEDYYVTKVDDNVQIIDSYQEKKLDNEAEKIVQILEREAARKRKVGGKTKKKHTKKNQSRKVRIKKKSTKKKLSKKVRQTKKI